MTLRINSVSLMNLFSILHIVATRNSGYYYGIILEINYDDKGAHDGRYVTKGGPKFNPGVSRGDYLRIISLSHMTFIKHIC